MTNHQALHHLLTLLLVGNVQLRGPTIITIVSTAIVNEEIKRNNTLLSLSSLSH